MMKLGTDRAWRMKVGEEFQYDRDNKLLKLTNSKADGGILSSFSYTYDLVGRQLTKQDSYGASTYTYNDDGRILIEETPGRTAVYTYDKSSNRLSQNESYSSDQPILKMSIDSSI